MFSLKTPWSKHSVDVGFEVRREKTAQGNFLFIDDEKLYREYVIDTLALRGVPMRKTASIFAWPLGIAEEWATQDISGHAETAKTFAKNEISATKQKDAKTELFLVFSSHEYNYKQAYQTYMLIHNMAAMAKSSLSQGELAQLHGGQAHFSLNTSVYGIWTIAADSLCAKYAKLQDSRFPDVYLPKAEAMRVIAPVEVSGYDGIDIPTGWGRFKIRNGGHLAIAVAEKDADTTGFQELQRRAGQNNARYLEDNERAELDIYGIEPGYVAANYQAAAVAN